MKRRIEKLLIAVLVIIVIVISLKYKNLLEEHTLQQSNLNSVFIAELRTANGLFGSNLFASENYNYNDAISHIVSAIKLFQFTTYRINNNGLQEPLDNLSLLMKREENKETIIEKSNLLHDELFKLSNNPDDKIATANLVVLVEEIRQKK